VLFDGLARGRYGQAQLERQFWGDVFGKYGITWQVNIGAAAPDGAGRPVAPAPDGTRPASSFDPGGWQCCYAGAALNGTAASGVLTRKVSDSKKYSRTVLASWDS
jgi:hypothetical protein